MNKSIIVCTKNSITSIEKCLNSITAQSPDELIVVDAGSTDGTVEIARAFTSHIITGAGKGLTADRQIGIEAANYNLAFFVDSDHILPKNYLLDMEEILLTSNYLLIQSKLQIYKPVGILNCGEDAYYRLIHNNSDEEIIPGIAPAIFWRGKLANGSGMEIDDGLTNTIEDTSWAEKAKSRRFSIAIAGPIVSQMHKSGSYEYFKKFRWYGIGDGEFCLTHSRRALGHLYHLSVRYPIIYSWKAVVSGELIAVPFLIFQGYIRLFYCLREIAKSYFIYQIASLRR
jgi:glycosyltransferase involved in cell wall biosynthesis